MIDPELKEHLEKIELEIIQTRKKSTSISHALSLGVVYGAGYVIGAVLIIVIVSWILNVIGVIPALSRQASEFRTALENFSRR